MLRVNLRLRFAGLLQAAQFQSQLGPRWAQQLHAALPTRELPPALAAGRGAHARREEGGGRGRRGVGRGLPPVGQHGPRSSTFGPWQLSTAAIPHNCTAKLRIQSIWPGKGSGKSRGGHGSRVAQLPCGG